jgi:hypothetical protein
MGDRDLKGEISYETYSNAQPMISQTGQDLINMQVKLFSKGLKRVTKEMTKESPMSNEKTLIHEQ